MDWMKRKLAINIVYTLVFYCKEEIMAVKENIIEFLNMLKEDSVDEVREVCMHTLKFLGEEFEIDGDEFDLNFENENTKPKNMFNKYNNKNTNTNRNNKSNNQKKLNRTYDGGENETIGSVKSNKPQNNKVNIKKIQVQNPNPNQNQSNSKDENLRLKLQKEKEYLEKIERDFMEKKKIIMQTTIIIIIMETDQIIIH
jgi:hypothetical protein